MVLRSICSNASRSLGVSMSGRASKFASIGALSPASFGRVLRRCIVLLPPFHFVFLTQPYETIEYGLMALRCQKGSRSARYFSGRLVESNALTASFVRFTTVRATEDRSRLRLWSYAEAKIEQLA